MHVHRLLAALLFLLCLSGCASVSLVESWKDQETPRKRYGDLLVVAISENRQARQIVEEVLAAELRKKGLSATPSYTVTGVEAQLSRSLIEKAVQATAADSVVTTRLVDLKERKHSSGGFVMTSRETTGYADYYGAGMVSYATFDMKPVEITTSTTYALETNLFDTATQRLVWGGITNAVDPTGVITLSERYSGVVIDALSREGFIK
jgi:hypothetical protein